MTRSHAVPVLHGIVVAPITRTRRDVSTELRLDEQAGLREPCVASFDNLQRVSRGDLTERVGTVPDARLEICRALSALADC